MHDQPERSVSSWESGEPSETPSAPDLSTSVENDALFIAPKHSNRRPQEKPVNVGTWSFNVGVVSALIAFVVAYLVTTCFHVSRGQLSGKDFAYYKTIQRSEQGIPFNKRRLAEHNEEEEVSPEEWLWPLIQCSEMQSGPSHTGETYAITAADKHGEWHAEGVSKAFEDTSVSVGSPVHFSQTRKSAEGGNGGEQAAGVLEEGGAGGDISGAAQYRNLLLLLHRQNQEVATATRRATVGRDMKVTGIVEVPSASEGRVELFEAIPVTEASGASAQEVSRVASSSPTTTKEKLKLADFGSGVYGMTLPSTTGLIAGHVKILRTDLPGPRTSVNVVLTKLPEVAVASRRRTQLLIDGFVISLEDDDDEKGSASNMVPPIPPETAAALSRRRRGIPAWKEAASLGINVLALLNRELAEEARRQKRALRVGNLPGAFIWVHTGHMLCPDLSPNEVRVDIYPLLEGESRAQGFFEPLLVSRTSVLSVWMHAPASVAKGNIFDFGSYTVKVELHGLASADRVFIQSSSIQPLGVVVGVRKKG